MYYVVTEIVREMGHGIAAWLAERPRLAQGLKAAAALAALWLLYALGSWLIFGPPPEALAYRTITGTVLYEDGSVIPGGPLLLELIPAVEPSQAQGERPAAFLVDGETGKFSGVITYLRANKARTINYRAVLRTPEQALLPAEIVPTPYGDPVATPARLNIMDRRLTIRVRKP